MQRVALWSLLVLWCAWAAGEPITLALVQTSSHPLAWVRLGLALGTGALAVGALLRPRLRLACVALAVLPPLEWALVGIDQDEPTHLHWAWQISHGLVPYRDFFEVRHFLWHLLLAPLVRLMEGDLHVIVVAKLITLAITLVAIALTADLCRSLGGRPEVAWLAALSNPTLFIPGGEVRGDPPAACLDALALWLLQRKRPGLAGLCAGVAYLMLQKSLFPIAAIALAALVCRGWRPFVRFTLVAAFVGALYFVWAAALGVLELYWRYCYVYTRLFVHVLRSHSVWHSGFVLLTRDQFLANPWCPLLAVVGAAVLFRGSGDARQLALTFVLVWLEAFILAISDRQYLMFQNLVLASVVGMGAGHLWPEGHRLARGVAPLAIGLFACLALLRWAADPPVPKDLTDAATALRESVPSDTYYGEEPLGALSNPIFRPNAVYYGNAPLVVARFFALGNIVLPEGQPGDLQDLRRHVPSMISLSDRERERQLLELLARDGHRYRKEGNLLILQRR